MKCFFLLEVNKPIKKIRIPINKRGIPIIAPIRVIVRTKPTTITIKPVKMNEGRIPKEKQRKYIRVVGVDLYYNFDFFTVWKDMKWKDNI